MLVYQLLAEGYTRPLPSIDPSLTIERALYCTADLRFIFLPRVGQDTFQLASTLHDYSFPWGQWTAEHCVLNGRRNISQSSDFFHISTLPGTTPLQMKLRLKPVQDENQW